MLSGATLAGLCLILGFQSPRDQVILHGATFKVHTGKYLEFYYTGEFNTQVEALSARSDDFLDNLQKIWRILLPEEKLRVSLLRVPPGSPEIAHCREPQWLSAAYVEANRRIILRVTPPQMFDIEAVSRSLNHHLVHYILRLYPGDRPPPFVEEGLAKLFDGSPAGPDHYFALVGFHHAESLGPFLEDPASYQNQRELNYAGAIGRQFILWLRRLKPQGDQILIQEYLKYQSWEQGLSAAGFTSAPQLLRRFESEVGPAFGWMRLLRMADFWITLFGLLTIAAMVFQLIKAFQLCRMVQITIEADPVKLTPFVDPSLLAGPAFGAPTATKPSMDKPRLEPSPRREPSPVQARTSAPAVRGPAGSRTALDRGQAQSATSELGRIEQKAARPHLIQHRPAAKRHRENKQIDSDLDRLFASFPDPGPAQAAPNPEAKGSMGSTQEIEADLDRFFGDLGGNEKKP